MGAGPHEEGGCTGTTDLVVVGVDGTPSSRSALRWALDRAERRGGEVLAVTVAEAPPPAVGDAGAAVLPPQDLTAIAASELEGMVAEETAGRSVGCESRVLGGSVVRGLARQARDAALLVLGNSGDQRLWGVGSVGRRCARHLDRPTVWVPPDAPPPEEKVLVVGIDGSATCRAALRWALGEAAVTGDRVEVVAVQYRPMHTDGGRADPDVDDATGRLVSAELDDVFGGQPDEVPVSVDVVTLRGTPSDVLLARSVRRRALVLGDAQRPAVADALLGSVAASCLRHAVGPVVLVPG